MIENKAVRRARRLRHHVKSSSAGTGRQRLSIFRSNSHIYAQIIDDNEGKTLVSASTVDKEVRDGIASGATIDAAVKVGEEIAKRAKKAGVKDVFFDRGAFRYHGRVKALADAARSGGLNF